MQLCRLGRCCLYSAGLWLGVAVEGLGVEVGGVGMVVEKGGGREGVAEVVIVSDGGGGGERQCAGTLMGDAATCV